MTMLIPIAISVIIAFLGIAYNESKNEGGSVFSDENCTVLIFAVGWPFIVFFLAVVFPFWLFFRLAKWFGRTWL